MKRYHHKTQKAINAYAEKYLTLYRNSRNNGDTVQTARWRANFAMNIEAGLRPSLRGNVYYITNARYTNASKLYDHA